MAAAAAVPWNGKHRLVAWVLFGIFMAGLILFFVSYVGNSWYVVPVENNDYPPDNPVPPLNFGLFYMCFRGHCKYDLRQDYFIVNLIPQTLGITWAYQQFRTACMAIETVAAILCLFTMGIYLLFLSGFTKSHLAGYAAGGLEIAAGVASLIGVIVFGQQFRGSTVKSPFGWSFGLMIVAFIILILNGIATVVITLTIHRRLQTAPPQFDASASGDDSRLLARKA